jgi:hypothetical protein
VVKQGLLDALEAPATQKTVFGPTNAVSGCRQALALPPVGVLRSVGSEPLTSSCAMNTSITASLQQSNRCPRMVRTKFCNIT